MTPSGLETTRGRHPLTPYAVGLSASSLLGGTALALAGGPAAVRLAAPIAAGLAIAVWLLFGRRRPWAAFPAVMLLAAGVLALVARHVAGQTLPLAPRGLFIAALLSYGAIGVAAALRLLRVLDTGRALLLSCSTALALGVGEALVPEPTSPFYTEWRVSAFNDPEVGFRYQPHSTAANFYPDNPRGYFEESDPLAATWSVETHEGSVASLAPPSPGERGHVRVTIQKLTGNASWFVKLQQAPFAIVGHQPYVLRFRARAAAPRAIGCAVGRNAEPWNLVSSYGEFNLGTEWQPYEMAFVASSSEPAARIFCDLATSPSAVELADVTLVNQTSGTALQPGMDSVKYFVSYRFNAFGFRGPDYAIPRPPDTFRILALGDSYAMGVGVHERDTLAAQLQRGLAKSGARLNYEVINAGISGYSTREERLSYERIASQYDAQVVLLLMVFNDDLTFRDEVDRGFVPTAPTTAPAFRVFDRAKRAVAEPARDYDYRETMREVLELDDAVRAKGGKLVVAVFRNSDTFTPWLRLVDTAQQALAGTGIPFIDLGPAILAGVANPLDLTVHRVDGHPNEIANRLAAEALQRFLAENGLLGSSVVSERSPSASEAPRP